MNNQNKQNGFSMLEALVAMVIISLGMLGIAGIIANSLKVNQGAQTRSQASWLANDIIDRMRANRTTAEGGDYALGGCNALPAGGTIATDDLNQWCAALAAVLPSGTGAVNVAATEVTVTVQWDDATRLAADATVENSGVLVVETRL